jgi:hypothetical protein
MGSDLRFVVFPTIIFLASTCKSQKTSWLPFTYSSEIFISAWDCIDDHKCEEVSLQWQSGRFWQGLGGSLGCLQRNCNRYDLYQAPSCTQKDERFGITRLYGCLYRRRRYCRGISITLRNVWCCVCCSVQQCEPVFWIFSRVGGSCGQCRIILCCSIFSETDILFNCFYAIR